MTGAAWEYATILVASFVLSFVLTPVALRLAVRHDLLDHPTGHKGHEVPMPYLGGVVLVVAFSVAVLLAALVNPPTTGTDELVAVMAMALGLSLIGLLDDLRGLGPMVRVGAELFAGIGIWSVGAGVELASSDVLNAVITVVWVVGITNAFNLLDNMDGLSAGIVAISAGWFFVIAVVNGQFLVGGLSMALVGCAVGFLPHNFPPARIYMGDAGSLYLGFLLAFVGLKLRFDAPDEVTYLTPILVLAVPILDTTLVTIDRLRHGRSPFRGGRDHISHRLVRLGLSVRAAVGVIYVAGALFGAIGLVVSRINRTAAHVVAGTVLLVALAAVAALGRAAVSDDRNPSDRAPQ